MLSLVNVIIRLMESNFIVLFSKGYSYHVINFGLSQNDRIKRPLLYAEKQA